MKDKIVDFINKIEEEKKVKVLLACETGSRAWGFPSPDSDYDVRILYVHERDWYIQLSEGRDSIEAMLENNDLDISGWELRKALRLLMKSNAPLLERIQSPIIYSADESFLKEVNSLAPKFYSKIATMHHYLSMAKKCNEEVRTGGEYKLKKLFYALRTAVACKWIQDKQEIPPIQFEKMLEALEIDSVIKDKIQDLISLKSTKNESYMHSGQEDILSFISHCIDKADKVVKSLPANKGDVELLNQFLRKHIIA